MTDALHYTAIGDSWTSPIPEVAEPWPALASKLLEDRLAARVSVENHAVYGATSEDVLQRQMAGALESDPNVVTILCGANDLAESPRPDFDAYAVRLATAVRRMRRRRPGTLVLTGTMPDVWRHGAIRPRTRARISRDLPRLNDITRKTAAECGAVCVDLASVPLTRARAFYGPDGFHPSQQGHAFMATAFASAIGDRLNGGGSK